MHRLLKGRFCLVASHTLEETGHARSLLCVRHQAGPRWLLLASEGEATVSVIFPFPDLGHRWGTS